MGYDYYYTDDVEREIKNMQNGNGGSANYGLAMASLVMGIVSLVFFLFLLNIISAILAIIFGIIFLGTSRKGEKGRALAVAGIITSVLSIVFCIGSYMIVFQNADNVTEMMENELRNSNPQFHYYQETDPFDDFDNLEDFLEKEDDTL